jgi:hypothetical protein
VKIGIDMDDTICKGPDDTVPEAMSDEWNTRIENAIIIEGSIDSIKKLIDLNHQIFFVSSRYTNDRKTTEAWLEKSGITTGYTLCLRLPDLYGPQFKRIMIGALGLDVYIDDKPRLIDIAKDLVFYPILFKDWNQTMNEIDCIRLMRKRK